MTCDFKSSSSLCSTTHMINCPETSCQSTQIKKDGFYKRANDSRKIQRFRCQCCGKSFSRATFSLAYRQKKRRINHSLWKQLMSSVSQRRCAKNLRVHRTTIHRRLKYFARKAKLEHSKFLELLKEKKSAHIQFDDLITIEQTKLKPLSVSVICDVKTRVILAAKVSQIAAFGKIAKRSRQKYGVRGSNLAENLEELFCQVKSVIDEDAKIDSDQHPLYPKVVKRHFPQSRHRRFKSDPACVVGQGELKKNKKDPLFCINQILGMFRDNIKRLARKSWCTTKSPEKLQELIDIYVHFHNTQLI